jgi:hypothetical protein
MSYTVRGDFGDESRLAMLRDGVSELSSAINFAKLCRNAGCHTITILDKKTRRLLSEAQISAKLIEPFHRGDASLQFRETSSTRTG